MKRLAVALCLLAAASANICHIYEQKLNDRGGIDVNDVPEAVLMATDCDSCVATKQNGQLIVGCLKDNITRQLLQVETKHRPHCPNGHYDFKCNGEACCCRGEFCFDHIREYFSSTKATQESVCSVYRLPFDANGSVSTEKVPKKERFIRQHCALCCSQKDDSGVEFRCIDSGDVNRNCEDKKTFPGGALACDAGKSSCCCKGSTCEEDFRLLYAKKELPESTIDTPYSGSSSTSSALYGTVVIALISFLMQ